MLDEWPLIFFDSVQFVLCLISEKSYSVHDAEYPGFRHFLHLWYDWVLVFCSSGRVPISEQAEDSFRAERKLHHSSALNGSNKETEAQLGSQSSLGPEPGPKSQ